MELTSTNTAYAVMLPSKFTVKHTNPCLDSKSQSIDYTQTRACPYFKNGDKNEVNCSQTRKIVQIISRYYLAI
ncbi:MAG: hypothetical protein ACI9JO_000005 [Psychrobacter okhotskensis]|jgi:hypothetical protein